MQSCKKNKVTFGVGVLFVREGKKITTVTDNVGMNICVCKWSEMTECRYIAMHRLFEVTKNLEKYFPRAFQCVRTLCAAKEQQYYWKKIATHFSV